MDFGSERDVSFGVFVSIWRGEENIGLRSGSNCRMWMLQSASATAM